MNLTFRNIALCLLAFLFAGPTIAVAEQRRPNVVFFLLDDLGWKDLGCYGSDFYETPNIDAFAKQSVRFPQA